MLCLVAALAVPRTPDAHAALAEPEAGDTHELERGLFDRTACKDRIKDDMSIWDAMAACGVRSRTRRGALDDDEDDDNLKWAKEKIEQFEQEQVQGVIDQQ